jgi:mono/diheme cytochrome c family protein
MRTTTTILSACCLALAGGLLAGCRGDRSDNPPRQFFPDMDDQPKWLPQSESPFFVNGKADRVPDARAVAFGPMPTPAAEGAAWAASFNAERAELLKDDRVFMLGESPTGDGYIDRIPVPVTRAMIERGRERFNISCSSCHGYLGDGTGTVGVRWSYPPANLLAAPFNDRAQDRGKDGWIFHVIREGVWGPDGSNKMPGYAHAVDPADAWAIVAYLRALQASQNATLGDLSEPARQRLTSDAGLPASQGGGN